MVTTAGRDEWQEFWSTQTDPIHRASDEAYYDRYAQELRIVFGAEPFDSVIEVGCGNGVFYRRLGFDHARYKGYDYSPAMVEAFRTSFPAADVAIGALQGVAPEGAVDLVFSNGVLQYVSLDDVRRHLAAFRKAMTPNGRIVHASIPWKPLKAHFHLDRLLPTERAMSTRKKVAVGLAVVGLRDDKIGRWYDTPELREIARAEGYEPTFFGSLHYPYRLHVAFRPV
jgi:trans-aconitate methyltransferase